MLHDIVSDEVSLTEIATAGQCNDVEVFSTYNRSVVI